MKQTHSKQLKSDFVALELTLNDTKQKHGQVSPNAMKVWDETTPIF